DHPHSFHYSITGSNRGTVVVVISVKLKSQSLQAPRPFFSLTEFRHFCALETVPFLFASFESHRQPLLYSLPEEPACCVEPGIRFFAKP
ncbi:hypothetical protein SDJN02_20882, partial [Cucurbita argyrosperma subsp. argyrosperma]